MKFVIKDRARRQLFISIFQQLKIFTRTLCLFFNDDYLYIQGMDSSHICLYEAKLTDEWFFSYEKKEGDHGMICLNPSTLSLILSMADENAFIVFEYENELDNLEIQICGECEKCFSIPLIDYEAEILNIPSCDYENQFSLPAKKICEIVSQLSVFGDILNMSVVNDELTLGTSGDLGAMKVNVDCGPLSDFEASFSLSYLHKYCLTTKLTNCIHFSLTKNFPLRICYQIDDNYIVFFIAPKME